VAEQAQPQLRRERGLVGLAHPHPGEEGGDDQAEVLEAVAQRRSGVDEAAQAGVEVGAELAGRHQLVERARRGRQEADYLRARAASTTPSLLAGAQIRDIPSHTFRYGLRWDPVAHLSVSLWGRAYGATRTTDGITGADTIPPVALFDGSVGYQASRWTLQVVGTNLTNRYYERGGTAVARPLAREGLEVEAVLSLKL
jgi:hypothetical protein